MRIQFKQMPKIKKLHIKSIKIIKISESWPVQWRRLWLHEWAQNWSLATGIWLCITASLTEWRAKDSLPFKSQPQDTQKPAWECASQQILLNYPSQHHRIRITECQWLEGTSKDHRWTLGNLETNGIFEIFLVLLFLANLRKRWYNILILKSFLGSLLTFRTSCDFEIN